MSTVLITGGATGIGLAFAKRFANAGHRVVVCGRRRESLDTARREVEGLEAIRCDLSDENERARLFELATSQYPELNVLVNNAGIQVRPPRIGEPQDWHALRNEIAINYEAPVHLTSLFVPFLLRQPDPMLVNVSSGLAFVPVAWAANYCATKAALHSFTLSVRKQLEETPLRVVEIVPPAVNTDLGGPGLHLTGVPLEPFADETFRRLSAGENEIGYGTAEQRRLLGRTELDRAFEAMNSPG